MIVSTNTSMVPTPPNSKMLHCNFMQIEKGNKLKM